MEEEEAEVSGGGGGRWEIRGEMMESMRRWGRRRHIRRGTHLLLCLLHACLAPLCLTCYSLMPHCLYSASCALPLLLLSWRGIAAKAKINRRHEIMAKK
jgi:hypothetical protein